MKNFVDILFGSALLWNAILFLPQFYKLYKSKNSENISLLTFAGFNIVQIMSIINGYIYKDYTLMFGFILAFITCGMVTICAFYYRFFVKKQRKSYG